MRLGFLLLLLLAVPAFAQPLDQPVAASQNLQEGPQHGVLANLKGLLGRHLGMGLSASYDWVEGDWDRPFSLGPVGSWKVSDRLLIASGSKYVVNAHTFRSFVDVRVPLYGAP